VRVSTPSPLYLCIHGHFYQPPRENPWLEAVEVQDSAAPYHDWNQRILRECYAPNGRARLVDNGGKIVGLINNYAWMSFNFGPTLLQWMETAAPDVLDKIVEGDRLSRERRHGHGNALAQVYNHVIMPLASAEDRRTQVLWGNADFRRRFGRDPEGMWLAETAADIPSLEALAEAGIRFTVLAPRQAKRWRRLGDDKWQEGGIDPSRAYLCRLPSGKSIALFFYNGDVSQQVAFERLLDSGEKFLARLLTGFEPKREHPQLMHMATDGESYGHHHAHGDMALAYVLERLRQDPNVRLTNYGEFLELHPPAWEVEIHENSSWSCVHGVERWRSDCGCNTGRGWHQKWRQPLRQALDTLKEKFDQVFVSEGAKLFPDPWAARNGYIDVVYERNDDTVHGFFERYGRPGLELLQVRDGLRLLEMQRHALLMFTSCAWFFDEISGLETTQCLCYAARAIQLARYFCIDGEPEFVQQLEKAPSNLPALGNGAVAWEKYVLPSRVDLERVLAHYAISLIYRSRTEQDRLYTFDLRTLDQEVRDRGNSHLALGRLKVRSQLTGNEREATFVVLHYGGLDFYAVLRKEHHPEEFEAFKTRLLELFKTGSLADITTLVAREYEGKAYHLEDLFMEEQRRIIRIVMQDRFEDYRRSFELLADQDTVMLDRLARMRYPIPKPLLAAATLALDGRLFQELGQLDTEGSLERIKALLERGKPWGYLVKGEELGKLLREELYVVLAELNPAADLAALVARAGHVLDVAFLLGITLDLWRPQNQLLDAYARLPPEERDQPPLRDAFMQLANRLDINPALLGWRP
jgi:alpha-amylase/alpha-mannosidase (GH57 family)